MNEIEGQLQPATDTGLAVDGATNGVALEPGKMPSRPLVAMAHPSPYLKRRMLYYVRRSLRQRRSRSSRQAVQLLLLCVLLFGVLTPLILTADYSIRVVSTLETLGAHASGGIQHLLDAKTALTATHAHGADSSTLLDPDAMRRASASLAAAHTDFTQEKDLLARSGLLQDVGHVLPQYQPQITTALASCQMGIDVSSAGQELLAAGQALAPRLHGSLLGDSGQPLLTTADLTSLHTTLDHLQPLLDDMLTQSHHLSLGLLPLNSEQRTQIDHYIQLLPGIDDGVKLARNALDPLGWFLGVGQPRTFLVQTLDRGELRATGGFTGQYGELHINGGRVAPFSLQNIALLEYTSSSITNGQEAPPAYRSWWPFANWGLRDSNLSADFPTSARLSLDLYQRETGREADGVIMFSSIVIRHVLEAFGSVSIPAYHETITAQNLEDRLHYYQDGGEGMSKAKAIEHVDGNEQARKLFTGRLARALMDRVRGASTHELLGLAQQFWQDLQTRDLEIYVNHTPLQDLLAGQNLAAQMDRSTIHDGLYIVQSNVSASKASPYVHTIINDTVQLDATGGATHTLQLRLAYTQIGDVYGLDTYRDYVRVYVNSPASLLWGDGFDSGKPLCGGPFQACAADSIYPRDELLCPTGLYQAGASAPMLGDPYTGQYHPLDEIGPPTNLQSDEPGRSMFAGYVVIPKNCTLTVTLSWHVPPTGHPYSLLVQRQTGTYPELNLTVLPVAGSCNGLHVSTVLDKDAIFSLNAGQPHQGQPGSAGCYQQAAV